MEIELAGVYSALAYYHLNREQIEVDIKANREGRNPIFTVIENRHIQERKPMI